jgi:hypothetical protein
MTFPRHSTALGAVAFALVIASAACGSPSAPSPPTLSQQVTTIVTNTDKALSHDYSSKHPSQGYANFARDFRHAADQFRALAFPASMHAAAHGLETSLDTLAADSTRLSAAEAKNQKVEANVIATAKANLTFMEDQKAEMKASNALRRLLGLPLETTTTTTTTAPPPTPTLPPVTTSTTTTSATPVSPAS